MSKEAFRAELEHLINCQSMENGSDTPDFILAEYLSDCLIVYDKTIQAREKWYGREAGLLNNLTPPEQGNTIPTIDVEPVAASTPGSV